MPQPEIDLNACIAGDREAWDAFVERYSGVIYAAVHRTMRAGARRSRTSIEDPVQDVFVRLIRNDYRLLRSYDPQRSALATWLTLIARSVAIDHLRKKRLAAGPLPDLEPIDDGASRPPDPSAPEPPLHVLSRRQALVLRMLFDEDLSVPEVAARLGVDEQTVRSTKHKALTRLRARMVPPDKPLPGDAAPPDPVQPHGTDRHGTL